MNKTIIFLIWIFILFTNCKSKTDCSIYTKDSIPTNFSESLELLDCFMDDDFKTEFKQKEESKAVTELHFGLGKSIRNNWGLWDGQNEIYSFFKNNGIYQPDDISTIILTSFHRKLNDTNINLENQIAEYQKFYEKAKKEYEEKLKKENEFFESFKIGDYVKIVFTEKFDENGGSINLLPKNYNRESFSNCNSRGYIVNKWTKENERPKRQHFFDIKMDYICEYREVKFRDTILKKGDTLSYSITYNNIEKIITTANTVYN